MKHYPVLKKEVLDSFHLKSDGIYVDATLGYAGHSKEILKRIPKGYLYAFDQDKEAITYASRILKSIGSNYEIIHSNFVNLKEELQKRHVTHVDGILFDLGVSSPQIDSQTRGFSFMREEILDMRMNQEQAFSAKELVNTYSEYELSQLFFQYGEEKRSKIIAKKMVEARSQKEIETTFHLVQIIKQAVGANYFYKNHPERNIFQAIRIEVNQELNVLKKVLPDAISLLKKEGRIAVITFHSLEDRIVKKIFLEYSKIDEMVKGLPNIPEQYLPTIKLMNSKPILPNEKELLENTRSKSAKLRVIERIKENDEEKEKKS